MSIRTREEVLEMYEEYTSGKSLKEVGDLYGLTSSRVGQLFEREGLERRSKREMAIRATDISDQEIIDLYKELGSVEAIRSRTNLSRAYITEIANTIPNREVYQRSRHPLVYSESDYVRALKRAAKVNGQPLTIPAYRRTAKAEGLPTLTSTLKFFGSWKDALKAAGIKGNPSMNHHWGYTKDDCVEAIIACINDLHKVPTYEEYCAWREKGQPSGSTVRNKVGWQKAVKIALDKSAAHGVQYPV